MRPGSCVASSFLCVFFVTDVLSSSEFYIDWKEASRQCKTKYDSELITFDYIKTENLSSEIISDLGNNISAWIDGKVRLLGCTDDVCYRVHQIHTTEDRKHPTICVDTPDMINVWFSEMSYKQSQDKCGTERYRLTDINLKTDRIPVDKTSNVFWLPNIELTTDEGECTFVITRNNESLELKYDNCSIPKMAVCINNSYIPDHHVTTFLEMAPKVTDEELLVENEKDGAYKAESLQILGPTRTDGTSGDVWHLKSLLPFALSGFNLILFLVLMCAMVALWKKVLSKLKQMAKIVDPPKSSKKSKLKRKKIFQQTEYQGLACSSPGNSTRVKLLPEEENPYSEISGKESCLVGAEGRVPGASCNGYVDMKSMMPDNEHCSSFKIGKKSYSPQRHPIYI
uniref:Uncharacterized protein LOC111123284 n=1 Tax=Crassostrea virginica TaxID=6565 RepID=A0A8B8D354_CRAVI|nr:uncharacterized protein LOC111123284 [Crassostrea virginica]